MSSISREEELAWAAGVFDGEGSTTTSGPWETPHVSVPQAGELDGPPEMLLRFRAAVGRGSIRGPAIHERWKPAWRHVATGGNAIRILELLWPDLGDVKRRQAEAALARHRTHATPYERIAASTGRPLVRRLVCKHGHPLPAEIRDRRRSCRACGRMRDTARRARERG